MSPKPFATSNSQYDDPKDDNATCPWCGNGYCNGECDRRLNAHRYGYSEKPGLNWPLAHWLRLLAISLLIVALFLGAGYAAQVAFAKDTRIGPVRAPASLLKARQACPNTATPVQCRAALRRAYAAVEWQRRARNQAHAYTSKDVVLDAIHWASAKTGVPAWRMIGIGTCESHLFWLAENGQYKSWAQLSSRHRSDPIIARLTWRDPYAVALHVALYIKHHGESEWQCQSTGGLRW